MQEIKVISRGQYSFTHYVFIDGFGMPSNQFELVKTQLDGFRIMVPIFPPFKAHTTNNLFELDTYTDEEYENLFKETIKKYGPNMK